MSDSAAEERFKGEWAKRRGLRESRSMSAHNPIGWLRGRKHVDASYVQPQWFDHGTCWTLEGKPFCVVGQPYSLDSDDLKQLAALSADGLDVCVSTYPAWHWPGNVLHVEVSISNAK